MKIYRMETLKNANGDRSGVTRTEPREDLDSLIVKALVYGTWRAWWTSTVWEAGQPVIMEAEQDDFTDPWRIVETDDARILAFFEQPDCDEIERSIVSGLQSFPYGLSADVAEEALAQVTQYDGYRVQSIEIADERTLHSTGQTDQAVAS